MHTNQTPKKYSKARFNDYQKAQAVDLYDRGHVSLEFLFQQHEITWQDLEMWRVDEYVKPHLYIQQDVRECAVVYYDFLTGQGARA